MARTSSSKRWLAEHFKDPYVKKAQIEGYRSRAAFKLLEIQTKEKILKSGMTVVDLGAAPGGWSQVAADIVGAKGQVIALDILPMNPLPGVTFIQGDFREDSVLATLMQAINDSTVDLVLSDMAPNIGGNRHVDMPRVYYLVELSFDFAQSILREKGDFLVKVFQGTGFEEFLKKMRATFERVVICKPDASRGRSKEQYILGRGFKKQ